MEDFMEKMQSILSDPESMQQISELAQMLKSETASDTAAAPEADSGGSSLFSDPAMLLKMGEILSSARKQDSNTALLHALRPHLNTQRQEKVDKAIKLLQLLTIWELLKQNDLLQKLW